MENHLSLRITVVGPPQGVTFCAQRGKDALVPPSRASDEQLLFEIPLRVVPDPKTGAPNFRGPFAQGPPSSRFLYINSGTSAGQAGSCWTRRAKVPLAGITWHLIEQALSNPEAVLAARIAGTGRDGGPACATVPLLDGWRVA